MVHYSKWWPCSWIVVPRHGVRKLTKQETPLVWETMLIVLEVGWCAYGLSLSSSAHNSCH